MEAYDTWIELLDAKHSKHKKTVLPDLFKVSKLAWWRDVKSYCAPCGKKLTHLPYLSLLHSLGLQRSQSATDPVELHPASHSVPTFKLKRSRTPENKTRTSAAFIPGQARKISVVNGKVQVEKARDVLSCFSPCLGLSYLLPCTSIVSSAYLLIGVSDILKTRACLLLQAMPRAQLNKKMAEDKKKEEDAKSKEEKSDVFERLPSYQVDLEARSIRGCYAW
jgi:hypothetical protein